LINAGQSYTAMAGNRPADEITPTIISVKMKRTLHTAQEHNQRNTGFTRGTREIWQNRGLIRQMIKREVIGRYRGSMLGIVWSFFNPVFMLLVYTFVFSVVFQARWGGGTENKSEFAILIFSGMIVHSLFAECISRAPGLILSNVSYVKKVVFPLQILPVITLGAALFHTLISVGVLLLFYALTHTQFNWTVVYLPLVILPYLLLILGISWFLAATGVFLRDVGQTTGILVTVLLFLSPVFYPVEAMPESYRPLLYLNPLTFTIEQVRDILIWNRGPDWAGLALDMLAGTSIACAGLFWFQKARKGFADVL